jgi:hypothetical protein
MVEVTLGVVTDLKYNRAQPAAAETDRAKLFWIVAPPVNQKGLIENLLRIFKANAMLPFDFPALLWVEFQTHTVYNPYTMPYRRIGTPSSTTSRNRTRANGWA